MSCVCRTLLSEPQVHSVWASNDEEGFTEVMENYQRKCYNSIFTFTFFTYSDDEHLLFVYFFRMNNAFALFPLLIEQ